MFAQRRLVWIEIIFGQRDTPFEVRISIRIREWYTSVKIPNIWRCRNMGFAWSVEIFARHTLHDVVPLFAFSLFMFPAETRLCSQRSPFTWWNRFVHAWSCTQECFSILTNLLFHRYTKCRWGLESVRFPLRTFEWRNKYCKYLNGSKWRPINAWCCTRSDQMMHVLRQLDKILFSLLFQVLVGFLYSPCGLHRDHI